MLYVDVKHGILYLLEELTAEVAGGHVLQVSSTAHFTAHIPVQVSPLQHQAHDHHSL